MIEGLLDATVRSRAGRCVVRRAGVLAAALAVVLSVLPAALAQAPSGGDPPIAAGGFDRPERVADLEGVFGTEVAAAPVAGEGPIVYWQDQDGLLARLAGGGRPQRVVESLGVRGVWAGAADGRPVVAWLERDLATGTSHLRVRWGDEVRTVIETRPSPLVAVVSATGTPELAYALPSTGGWTISLWTWDAGSVGSIARSDTLAGLDVARTGGELHLSWLEGRIERVLGRIDADFRAYLARWRDGAEAPYEVATLGPAAYRDERDVTRLGGPDANEVAYAQPDGVLVVAALDGTRRTLGRGAPIGWLAERWTWVVEDRVRREASADGAAPNGASAETVLRLPGEPQRIAAAEANGVVGIVWSRARYLGGLEIWAVSDATPYRSGPLERFAQAMGWDPWQLWTAAGGHLLLSLLVALIGSMAFGPLWWLGASLLARRATVSSLAIALEGAALGVATLLAVAIPVAIRVGRLGGPGAALLIDPAWLAAGAVAGVGIALLVVGRRDLEATFGRLLGAFVAGSILIAVTAFGTLSAWQRLIAQVT